MIKVLYALNDVFHKGGTEAVILNCFRNIDRERFHIDFLVHGEKNKDESNEIHKYLVKQGSTIYYATPRSVNYFRNMKEIHSVLRNNSYDILHSHMDAAGFFVLKAAQKANIQVRISHSHSTNHQINKGSALINKLYRIILEKARKGVIENSTGLIACSEDAGRWLFGNTPFLLLKNGIDVQNYAYCPEKAQALRTQHLVQHKFVLGHVGRFSHPKNHEFLIDVFFQLHSAVDNAVLFLIGEGELKSDIEQKVKALGLDGSVIFLGNRSDVPELLNMFDLLIFPSRFEGLPVVLVEAQANGLRCVVSNNIAKESNITGLVNFLSLETTKAWVDQIMSIHKENYGRVDTKLQMTESGYDIKAVVKQLEGFYIDQLANYSGKL